MRKHNTSLDQDASHLAHSEKCQKIGTGNRAITKAIPWNATDYLKTDEDIAEYLAVVFETGDVSDITHALSTVARARGMSNTAHSAALSRGTLYKATSTDANPTLSTLIAMLDAMNISLSAKPKLAST